MTVNVKDFLGKVDIFTFVREESSVVYWLAHRNPYQKDVV